jgi:hypothetical protein
MILNLCAKLSKETTKDGRKLITFLESIHKTSFARENTDHIYARVKRDLLAAVRDFPEVYIDVHGNLQKFPDGWTLVAPPSSFRGHRYPIAIQLAFAQNDMDGFLADIELDAMTGLQHAADALKHQFSGRTANAFDVSQALWFFEQLDVEYRLISPTTQGNEPPQRS